MYLVSGSCIVHLITLGLCNPLMNICACYKIGFDTICISQDMMFSREDINVSWETCDLLGGDWLCFLGKTQWGSIHNSIKDHFERSHYYNAMMCISTSCILMVVDYCWWGYWLCDHGGTRHFIVYHSPMVLSW